MALFQKYIDKNPTSPFLPEIYFRIGALYSVNRNVARGETTDRQQAAKYYELARKGYGTKFSYENVTAWASLANYSRDVAKIREYYDWLGKIQADGTLDDMHPIRNMCLYVKRATLELGPEEKQTMLKGAKENIPRFRSSAEIDMIFFASPADLALIVSDYPDTPLAGKAQETMASVPALHMDQMIADLAVSPKMLTSGDAVPVLSTESQAPDRPAIAQSIPNAPAQKRPSTGRAWMIAAGLAVGFVVAGGAIRYAMARRGN